MNSKEIAKLLFDLKEGNSDEFKLLIGEDKFNGYCLMGFINNNFNHWKATELGLKQWNFYREPTLEEKALGIYLHSIGF